MNQPLSVLGIDPCGIIIFIIANVLSWILIDWLILYFYDRFWEQAYPSNESNAVKKRELAKKFFYLRFGGMIGPLERVFYIYAVMMPQIQIIAPIIILKAFFGWITTPERIVDFLSAHAEDWPALKEDKSFVDGIVYVLYHSYIYGNILSLMLGLALGHIGVVARGLPATIASFH